MTAGALVQAPRPGDRRASCTQKTLDHPDGRSTWTRGSTSQEGRSTRPRLDRRDPARARARGATAVRLYMDLDRPLGQKSSPPSAPLIERRAARRAHAVPHRRRRSSTAGRSRSTRGVLIPRPETELLVEAVLDAPCPRTRRAASLDLCTGSGCIAISARRGAPRRPRSARRSCRRTRARLARENAESTGVGGRVTRRRGRSVRAAARGRALPAAMPSREPALHRTPRRCDACRRGRDTSRTSRSTAGEDGLDVIRRRRRGARDWLDAWRAPCNGDWRDRAGRSRRAAAARGGISQASRVEKDLERRTARIRDTACGIAATEGADMDEIVVKGGKRARGRGAGVRREERGAAHPRLFAAGATASTTSATCPDLGGRRHMLKVLAHHGLRGRAARRRRQSGPVACPDDDHPRGAVRAGEDHARVACWCWGRWSPATAGRASRCPAAAPSARGPSTSTSRASQAMGAEIELDAGLRRGPGRSGSRARDLTSTCITVTGTENLMMAAALAEGPHRARERRARAGGGGAGAGAQQDGRADRRRGHATSSPSTGVDDAAAGGPRHHPRPHRGGHAAGRRRPITGGDVAGRGAPCPSTWSRDRQAARGRRARSPTETGGMRCKARRAVRAGGHQDRGAPRLSHRHAGPADGAACRVARRHVA